MLKRPRVLQRMLCEDVIVIGSGAAEKMTWLDAYIGDVRRVRQPAEALVAHAVEQLVLHLFVRQVVQTLQDQNAHHRLGWILRAATLWADRPGRDAIHLSRQRHEVDVRLDLGKWITQRVDLLAVLVVSEQVGLDGAVGFIREDGYGVQAKRILPSGGWSEAFRGAYGMPN